MHAPLFLYLTDLMNKKILLFFLILTFLFSGISCSAGSELSAQQCYEKGMEKLRQEKKSEAFACFVLASKKDPSNPAYNWAAATAADNRNDAFVNAEDAWRKGLKLPQVLFLRAALSLHANKQEALEYALSGYKEMPDSVKTPDVRGEIFCRFGSYDSALTIWKPLYAKKPSGPLCVQIAMAYNAKADFQKARQILTDGRGRGLLDRAGYGVLASLLAFSFEYKSIDTLFYEMRQRGLLNDTACLDYADFLLSQERYNDAEKVLDKIKFGGGASDGAVNFQARIRLYFISFMLRQPEKIKQLETLVPANSAFKNQEKALIKSVTDVMTGSSKAFEEIEVSRRALPNSAVIGLLCARMNLDRGNYENASACYASLPALFSRSPRVLAERATILYKSGKDDDALSLINDLHGRNFYSKQSLELFRDIMLKKKSMEKCMAAQKMLEKRFPDDTGVILKKGILALAAGNTDTALSIFAVLSKAYPGEERFDALRISAFMVKKDYDRVIRECRASKASAATLAPIEAKALAYVGKIDEAMQVYEKALSEKKTKGLLLEYAFFLLDSKQPDKAARMFEELIAMNKNDRKSDKNETAVLYNDLAWALVTSDTCSSARLLDAAQHAYDLAPENLNILDTYSEALLKTGRFDDCIRLLKDNPLVIKEPTMLYHLGIAFEKTKDIRSACATYRLALAQADSAAPRLPVNFNRSELAARVQNMTKAK